MQDRRGIPLQSGQGSSAYELDEQEKLTCASFVLIFVTYVLRFVAMVEPTTKKPNALRELLDRHDEAINNIKIATRECRKLEGAIREWVGAQLAPTYEQWSPRLGEVAVCVNLRKTSRFAYRLYVRELYGTWVNFNEGENSQAYTRFNLGDYQKYFKHNKDLVGVEFIVPAHEYERHVRHWFDLPKLEGLDN
ncbi:MAG TPA: hypothetical protein PK156_31685 [Polyangium sp.]|nr:hypothetical protein [Polyangium sp.]